MRWRSSITLLILTAVLVVGAWFGWRAFRAPVNEPADQTAAHSCLHWRSYPSGLTVHAADIRVSVYNAGTVSGQAARVLATLHDRGFIAGVAANPPAGVEARDVTIITPTPRDPAVTLVKSQFKGVVRVSVQAELSRGVDVVIGEHYAGIEPKAPTALTLAAPVRVCTAHAD